MSAKPAIDVDWVKDILGKEKQVPLPGTLTALLKVGGRVEEYQGAATYTVRNDLVIVTVGSEAEWYAILYRQSGLPPGTDLSMKERKVDCAYQGPGRPFVKAFKGTYTLVREPGKFELVFEASESKDASIMSMKIVPRQRS
ncbi:hypothetical protein [Pseudomonas sp. Teo4]|uniref:hypothetical protein n=1 Tax=Pseudomonas sp. Teo4 TaxID=3064528 RepID=UPI002AB989C5|nr:hypothetical protein [Pseudomonas sp. Teo4]MDZ3991242.1 hypothetical protein [Pseudomonas sp. Teo4]